MQSHLISVHRTHQVLLVLSRSLALESNKIYTASTMQWWYHERLEEASVLDSDASHKNQCSAVSSCHNSISLSSECLDILFIVITMDKKYNIVYLMGLICAHETGTAIKHLP